MGIYNTQTAKGQEFQGASIGDSRRKYNLKTNSNKRVKLIDMNEVTRGNVICNKLKKACAKVN